MGFLRKQKKININMEINKEDIFSAIENLSSIKDSNKNKKISTLRSSEFSNSDLKITAKDIGKAFAKASKEYNTRYNIEETNISVFNSSKSKADKYEKENSSKVNSSDYYLFKKTSNNNEYSSMKKEDRAFDS